MSRILLVVALLTVSVLSIAQQPMLRSYPRPIMTRAVQEIMATRASFSPSLADEVDLPQFVDNSKRIFFPPVISQQGGSCAQASGIGYMFTYEMNRFLGRDAKLSDNRFSYAFTWNFLNGGIDTGGFVEEGLYIARRYGVMTEADYGLTNFLSFRWASGFDKYLRAMHYRADEIVYIEADTEQGIKLLKRYLYDAGDGSSAGGIVTYASCSTDWTIDTNYSGPSGTGYHALLTKLASEGSHALTIVGYDDLVEFTSPDGKTHNGAFIVCNTWGSYSHDNGRFYLPYYFFLTPSSVPKGGYLTTTCTGVKVSTFEPKVVARVNLDYSSRDDLVISYGFAMSRTATYATNASTTVVFNNQGGDHKMAGRYYASDSDLEFALDYTQKFTDIDTQKPERYFLYVLRNKRGETLGEGRLKALSVIDYRGETAKTYTCKIPAEGIQLAKGRNAFIVNTVPRLVMSASPYRLKADGNTTYVLRTTDNKATKILFTRNPDGTLNLKYEEI